MGYSRRNMSETACYAARHSSHRKEGGFLNDVFGDPDDVYEDNGNDPIVTITDVNNDQVRMIGIHKMLYSRENLEELLCERFPQGAFQIYNLAKIFRINTMGQFEQLMSDIIEMQNEELVGCYLVDDLWHVSGSPTVGCLDIEDNFLRGYVGVPKVDKKIKIEREYRETIQIWKNSYRRFVEWMKKKFSIGKKNKDIKQ